MADSNRKFETLTDAVHHTDGRMFAVSRSAVVLNEKGIHARPAGKIALIARKAGSTVKIVKDGQTADATEIMDILCLFCPMGTEIVIGAENMSDQHIVDEITELVKGKFEE